MVQHGRVLAVTLRRPRNTPPRRSTRFEHVAVASTLRVNEPLALTELSVSSAFVVSSPGQVKILRRPEHKTSSRPIAIELIANPAIRTSDCRRLANIKTRPLQCCLRTYRSPRQPAIRSTKLSDPLYLDWQFRLVEALQNLDINLKVRPHPEASTRTTEPIECNYSDGNRVF